MRKFVYMFEGGDTLSPDVYISEDYTSKDECEKDAVQYACKTGKNAKLFKVELFNRKSTGRIGWMYARTECGQIVRGRG